MASQASSEAPAPGFSVPVPSLPKLGRTWYKRGALYWLCRTRTAVFMVLVLAMFCVFALGLYSGFRDLLPPSVRVVWDGAQVVAAVAALVWGWTQQRRGHREALRHPPTPGETLQAKRDHNRRVPGLIAVGRGLVILAAPVMPAFAAWVVGWLVAWVTVREYPSEVGARRWLEEHSTGT
ncbi:hypothetical protein ACH47Z_20755 [Streptomyces sp. NPDC020192]|uniref:hypothetical protein n=1 Tax=Streptomyces sp. NPDC020192 TaxID=3365066 RepID=UPI00379FD7A0